jgi:general secretion pathway protein C
LAVLDLSRRGGSLSRAGLQGSRGWFARRWPTLLTLLLLTYFCWLLAQWIWYFLEPKAAATPTRAPNTASVAFNPGSVAGLFGDANAPAPAKQQVVVPTTLNVQLKGVFAEQGEELAHAILVVDGKEQGFRVGDQVLPGVMLQGVFGEHVIIKRGGASEKVAFAQYPAGGSGPAALGQPVPPAPGQPVPAQAGSPQFRLKVQPVAPNVMSFSRNQLQQSLEDVSQLSNLGRVGAAPGGGVAIEDVPPGSLAERLGLQLGDVVKQINGQTVNSPADLMRLYQEFDNAERVNIAGTRNGRPLQLTYNVQQ